MRNLGADLRARGHSAPADAAVIGGLALDGRRRNAYLRGARALSQALPAGPLYGLAVAMAVSRPYLGVHYPTDVVSGGLLGEALGRLLTP